MDAFKLLNACKTDEEKQILIKENNEIYAKEADIFAAFFVEQCMGCYGRELMWETFCAEVESFRLEMDDVQFKPSREYIISETAVCEFYGRDLEDSLKKYLNEYVEIDVDDMDLFVYFSGENKIGIGITTKWNTARDYNRRKEENSSQLNIEARGKIKVPTSNRKPQNPLAAMQEYEAKMEKSSRNSKRLFWWVVSLLACGVLYFFN